MINKNELIKEIDSLDSRLVGIRDAITTNDYIYLSHELTDEYATLKAKFDALVWVLNGDDEVGEELDEEKIKVIIEMKEVLHQHYKIELEITKDEYDEFIDDSGKIDKIMEKSMANNESAEDFMLALDHAGFKVLSFCEGDAEQNRLNYYDTYIEEEEEHDEA